MSQLQIHAVSCIELCSQPSQTHSGTFMLYKKLAGCVCKGCVHMPLQLTACKLTCEIDQIEWGCCTHVPCERFELKPILKVKLPSCQGQLPARDN